MLSKTPELQPGSEETARYIAGIAKELRMMAASADLGFLSYLLAMVEDDANDTVRRYEVERESAKLQPQSTSDTR